MTRFIPREKLGKKARKQLDSQRRATWPVPPVSRTFASRKDYNRKRKTRNDQDDWNGGFFSYPSFGIQLKKADINVIYYARLPE